MRRIRNAREAVAALGGIDAVASWRGIPRVVVIGWIERGAVERDSLVHVWYSLLCRGYEVSPRVFGMRSFESFRMPVSQLTTKGKRLSEIAH